jgi:predicted RecB family nuclease
MKCYLRSLGESDSRNAYAEWVREQNESYQSKANRRLQNDGELAVAPAATGNLNSAKWHLAVDVFARAIFEPTTARSVDSYNFEADTIANDTAQPDSRRSKQVLESRIHALERLPSKGRGKVAQFVPIRFIFRNTLTKDDKLALAFDAFVLSGMLGCEVGLGKIIHGDDYTSLTVKVSTLSGKVRKHLDNIVALVNNPVPPDLVLNRHCAECEFQARCWHKALEQDDLSLLAGMSVKERQKFRNKGIFTVTQLSYTFRPRRRPKRLRDKRERYHHSLKALAVREKKIHIVGCPELKIEGTPVFLDVEGLPDRDFYYLIGMRIGQGEATVQHSLWADTFKEEAKIWQQFLSILKTVEKPVLIHYGSYETRFLKKMKDRYNSLQDVESIATVVDSVINLLTVTFAQIYFPTYSNNLKEVAGYLGLSWSEPQATGLTSIIRRHEWEKSKDPTAKAKLIIYNAEDCSALSNLTQACTRIGDENSLANHQKLKTVVDSNSIRRQEHFRWSLEDFSVQDFAWINQAAYWNYQRQRVYIKSSKPLRSPKKRKKHPLYYDRDIEVSRTPTVCQVCGYAHLRKASYRSKVVHDLHFQRRGIVRKSWRLIASRYVCNNCGTKVLPLSYSLPRDKYGQGLIAYIIYHLVDAFVPQETVARILNRIFGFGFDGSGGINPIKARAANYYRPTYESILRDLVRGPLIHVDETRANIKGRRAYIWVFTSLEKVAYVYAETREAHLPKQMLADFNGVLVSDFYAAYDSLRCPQQKCLVHLLRDLNTDLLNAPFNLELREIANEFGSLLRSILLSVDRFGLKARFLRKHKSKVEQFLEKTIRHKFQTSAAIKYQNRLSKHRSGLFTFLEYDGVPWNNNNAEHAIKSFAQLRRVLKGTSTERGIHDYLVLLSICQTCKYMGVDFLAFLRSGKTDIAVLKSHRGG